MTIQVFVALGGPTHSIIYFSVFVQIRLFFPNFYFLLKEFINATIQFGLFYTYDLAHVFTDKYGLSNSLLLAMDICHTLEYYTVQLLVRYTHKYSRCYHRNI